MVRVNPTDSHNIYTCPCQRCKETRKDERHIFRMLFYPVIGIMIILCIL